MFYYIKSGNKYISPVLFQCSLHLSYIIILVSFVQQIEDATSVVLNKYSFITSFIILAVEHPLLDIGLLHRFQKDQLKAVCILFHLFT